MTSEERETAQPFQFRIHTSPRLTKMLIFVGISINWEDLQINLCLKAKLKEKRRCGGDFVASSDQVGTPDERTHAHSGALVGDSGSRSNEKVANKAPLY